MRGAFLVVLLCGVMDIEAAELPPVSALDPASVPQETEHAAAKSAMRSARAENSKYEVCGAVVQHSNGKYFWTTPVSSGETHKCDFRYNHVPGYTVVAVYHTHPDRLSFSTVDITVYDKHKINGYMIHSPTGLMFKWDNRKRKQERVN